MTSSHTILPEVVGVRISARCLAAALELTQLFSLNTQRMRPDPSKKADSRSSGSSPHR